MDIHSLPAVNATLNGTAAILSLLPTRFIRQRPNPGARRMMLTAFGVSIVFLICYLIYHSQSGDRCTIRKQARFATSISAF